MAELQAETTESIDALDAKLSRPNSNKGRIQRELWALLREHDRDGTLPTSGRFLFYELVQRGVVSKSNPGKRQPAADVTDALTVLRRAGIVPWESIVDETRRVEDYTGVENALDAVKLYAARVKLDPWEPERPPMVVTESMSLAGVLRETASMYRVPITATRGNSAGHLHVEVAPLLREGQRVVYLGDWDHAGGMIEKGNRATLEGVVGELDWGRLAVTEDQVREHDLPIIIKRDKRYNDGKPHEAVETEALSQRLIVQLLRDRLQELMPASMDAFREVERRERRRIVEMLGGDWFIEEHVAGDPSDEEEER